MTEENKTNWDKHTRLSLTSSSKASQPQQIIIEQAHDKIWAMKPSTIPIPTKVEDRTAEDTSNSNSVKVTDLINTNGECVNVKENVKDDKIEISGEYTEAYAAPDNNIKAIIRDCFRGVGLPGLNNILDQALSSLKSFIENYNTVTGK